MTKRAVGNRFDQQAVEEGSGTAVALRLLRLLRMIPRAPRRITSGELTRQLNTDSIPVHKRTVERQLAALLGAEFGVERDSSTKPHNWYRPKDAQGLTISDMTPAEALALYLGKTYLTELLPPAVRNQIEPFVTMAEKTLRHHPDTKRTGWSKKVAMVPATQPLLPPKHNPDVEGVVYQALLDGKQLDIEYASPYHPVKALGEHTIHPLGLVQRGPVTYLVASYFNYKEPRILALHRIRKATAALADAVPPPGFLLGSFVLQGEFGFDGSKEPVRLKLALTKDVAAFLGETPLASDQTINTEGERLILNATVRSDVQLERWLRAMGQGIEVLAPAALRRSIAMSLKAAAAQY